MTNKEAIDYINKEVKAKIDERLNQTTEWIKKSSRSISFSSETTTRIANDYLKSLGYKTSVCSYDCWRTYNIIYSLNYPINEDN